MSNINDVLQKGASVLRAQDSRIKELEQKVAGFDVMRDAIATVEILTKAGRLEDSDEPIVKRAEALLKATNYDSLTKEAESGNIHIDLEMFGDLEIGPPRDKEASVGTEIELDMEHNTFHQFIGE